MAQRTLNFTGRKRIEQKEALFSFSNNPDDAPEFNVELKLDTVDYPDDAALFVEAYYKETRHMFRMALCSRCLHGVFDRNRSRTFFLWLVA